MIVRIRVDRGVVAAPSRGALRVLGMVTARAGHRLGFDSVALRRVGIRIVGDAAMIELHRQHLGTAVPTDVLSFANDGSDDALFDDESRDEDLSDDEAAEPWNDDGTAWDDGAGPGDIAIDWDQVRRQAAVASPGGWLDEATQLVVHGLAHLAGHDHARRHEARRMLRAERRAARSASVASPVRPYGGAR